MTILDVVVDLARPHTTHRSPAKSNRARRERREAKRPTGIAEYLAVPDQLVQVRLAQLGDIHTECSVSRSWAWRCRQVAVFKRGTQFAGAARPSPHRYGREGRASSASRVASFSTRLERRMIRAMSSAVAERKGRKFIKNGGAILRIDQFRCDREILVTVTFAGPPTPPHQSFCPRGLKSAFPKTTLSPRIRLKTRN